MEEESADAPGFEGPGGLEIFELQEDAARLESGWGRLRD